MEKRKFGRNARKRRLLFTSVQGSRARAFRWFWDYVKGFSGPRPPGFLLAGVRHLRKKPSDDQ
jgi:hypothetical protein